MPYIHLQKNANKCFAICDANNFYVSCERLFQPKLNNKPVIVLSNNDQCTISRSNEAKALGVEMGAPIFQLGRLIKQHNIQVFSSNYALYGDISARITDVLMQMAPDVQVYSIDESFLDLSSMQKTYDLTEYCLNISNEIERRVGIPVSIGVGSTKTLAKLCNRIVKVYYQGGRVLHLSEIIDINQALLATPLGDIWGVGKKWQKQLNNLGYFNAHDLVSMKDGQIEEGFNINLARTIAELKGFSCIDIDDMFVNRKQIIVSKSFGKKLKSLAEIKYAASNYVSIAAEKLRNQQSVAKGIMIFLQKEGGPRTEKNSSSISLKLPSSTGDSRLFTRYAFLGLEKLFKEDTFYRKVGIMLSNIESQTKSQLDLFSEMSAECSNNVMGIMDDINHQFGRNAIQLASNGFSDEWKMKQEYKSPNYTTSWKDLLKVYAS